MPLHDPSWYPTCVQRFSPVPFTVFELQGLKLKNNNNNNNNNNNCKNELRLIFHMSPMQILSYYRQTCISDILPCGGERCGFSLKLKVILRFFKCMESMARDMRHPYIPSTTVLGDTEVVYAILTTRVIVARFCFSYIVDDIIWTEPSSFGWCQDHWIHYSCSSITTL